MFGFLGILLTIAGGGLIFEYPVLALPCFAGAYYAMLHGENHQAGEERFWGAFWVLGVLAIPILWVAGALGF
jgi:hypothetical protein